MRIMVIVLGLLVGIGALGVAGWYIRDEVVIRVAAYQFKEDIASLKLLWNRGELGGGCSSEEITVSNPILGLQVRFVDDTSYVFEPVCEIAVANSPIIKKGRLFGGAKREYGSGILLPSVEGVAGVANGWIHLAFENKTAVVGIFDGEPEIQWDSESYEIGGTTPAIANCSNWGFTCCTTDLGIGQGMQVYANDCSKTCFQKCVKRPEVVLFNASPGMNAVTRTVTLYGNDETVQFGYRVDDNSETSGVRIDFGDGSSSDLLGLNNDSVIHAYACRQSQCVYTAKLSVENDSGIKPADSAATSIKIVMQP